MSREKGEIEKFIRRYYDGEIIVSPQASKLMMQGGVSIADCLQKSIIQYMHEPPSDANGLTPNGKTAFAYITKIIAYGMVSPSHDLLGKLDAERKKNTELLRDLSICLTNYATLERKHTRLVDFLDKNLGSEWRKTESEGENNNGT
jgi:hypothetical protein